MRAAIDMLMATSHDERKTAVENGIQAFISQYVKYRQHKQCRSEDELTCDCVDALSNMGFFAEHDTQHGGHCDIVVKGSEGYVWLGEAKIHRDYGWLDKGLQQLLTRYASGIPSQCHGGVVIYCFTQRADKVLKKWAARVEKEQTVIRVDTKLDLQYFRSWHTHIGSGLKFEIKHQIIPLLFAPNDKRG